MLLGVARLCDVPSVLLARKGPSGQETIAHRCWPERDACEAALLDAGETHTVLSGAEACASIFGDETSVRSCLIARVIDLDGHTHGILCCADTRHRAFEDDEIEGTLAIASLCAGRLSSMSHAEMRARTRRAETESAACREASALLERVASCVPGMLYQFRMDTDGSSSFPYCSSGIKEVYGVDPEEVAHDASIVWSRLHPDDIEGVRESVVSSAEWLTPWRSRYRAVDADGNVRWLHGEATPERDTDGSTLWHGFIHDITEHVEQEQELDDARRAEVQASRVKSEFLANISHEIRTPLGAIMGYAEVLDQCAERLEDDQHDAVRTILRNGEHLLGLVNDLLDVEKIDSGHLSIERIPTAVDRVVTDALSALRMRAEAKGLTLGSTYETPIPERVSTDPTRLRQILLNLLGNAIKFTESGSVTVCVRFEEDEDEPRLALEVVDTGIGMTAGQLDVIRRFEAFTQADSSTTRRFGGTGLGLRISASLADRLGDGLEIESREGVGSTFRIRLDPGALAGVPMVCPAGGAARERRREDDTRVLAGLRVLLAEDGLDNQRLIHLHLTRAGAEVEIVDHGEEACDRLLGDGTPFDLVLMDMMMPVLDGYEATDRLRSGGYTGPIVAITAHASDADRAKCFGAGCDGYLTKPISARSLVHACVRFTRRSTAA